MNLTGIGTGASNEAQLLTVTATSSNPAVVPDPTLTYTSPDASGTLSFAPVANAFGSAVVTVKVKDNGGTSLGGGDEVTRTFTVSVTSQNDLPSLSAISDQIINEDAATSAIAFTVGDVETVAADLLVTARSSNETLVDSSGIQLSGAAANRTITLTPKLNQFGAATITLCASDADSGKTERSFQLTVSPVNDTPVLAAISAQTINEETQLTFTASATDIDVPAQELSYSLDAGAPSGATIHVSTGVFTWTPTEGQGPGEHTLTVRVTDNGTPALSATRSVTITVNEVNRAPVVESAECFF